MGHSTRSHASQQKDGKNIDEVVPKQFDRKDLAKLENFEIDETLLNQWELKNCFNVEWNPLSLKRCVDQWIAEGYSSNENGWKLRKEGALVKVWTRSKGTDANTNYPIFRVEHYFPDIDDPMIVFLAMNEYRHEWDSEALEINDLIQYTNANTYCKQVILKPIMKTYSRELLEKRWFWTCKQAVDLAEDKEAELGEGDLEDMYEWFSSMPGDKVPEEPKRLVRADQMFGVNRIGKMTNRPPKAAANQPENRGTYTTFVMQQDMKTGSTAMKMLLPVIHLTIESWGNSFRKYMAKNIDRIREDLENRRAQGKVPAQANDDPPATGEEQAEQQ